MEWIGNHAFMRIERVHVAHEISKCIALDIDASTGAFTCSVYERRPDVCRDLARGGGACQGELATKGDRPKRALVMLGRA